jgi:hypothetical protein
MTVSDLLKAGGIRWKFRVLWSMFMVRFAAFVAEHEARALRSLRRPIKSGSLTYGGRWDGVREFWMDKGGDK